jgi:protein-disulfide isomerase
MLPVINDLMKEDKKVRFVFKEFPILSDDSVTAARVALAVNRVAKDKYFAFHQELMKANVKFDEKMLLDTAKKVGADATKVKAEMAKPEITAILDKNREIAGALGVSGTPAIIMGNSITPGAVDLPTIKKMVAAVRAGKDPHEALKAADEALAAEAAKEAGKPAEAPKQ